MYGVETRALKQAVRRNLELFPEDFMFELSPEEIEIVVSQNVIPSRQHLGGSAPFAFSETGVAMLLSVLKGKREQSGLKLPDSLIAATALANELTLISRNASDFKKSLISN
ncbi:MAG: DNA-binding protein [Mucilaginibacter sp.]|jgi:hypothetical protein|nr:DNA-binding protein [Mucilaginibacter sp.]